MWLLNRVTTLDTFDSTECQVLFIIQEQANEREQEHEDYQKEVDKWKKIVQDIEKHNGYESRLQAEVHFKLDLH